MLDTKNIRYLVVHCSDTENKKKLSAIDIHQMHLSFGWNGIGYHKVILRGGQIENGRPEYWVGAHVKGYNEVSLGVCLIGRDNFTKKQMFSLEQILKQWKYKYPKAQIIGHHDIGNTTKTCPNFNVLNWIKEKGL